jgi:hypothetical protein
LGTASIDCELLQHNQIAARLTAVAIVLSTLSALVS